MAKRNFKKAQCADACAKARDDIHKALAQLTDRSSLMVLEKCITDIIQRGRWLQHREDQTRSYLH
jgi:hypothetical protein